MDFNIIGIKCDKLGCGYQEPDVKSEDYPTYLNKPCPKCGSNLLTEGDLKMTNLLARISNNPVIKALDDFTIWIGFKKRSYQVDMNGTGKVTLTRREDENKKD